MMQIEARSRKPHVRLNRHVQSKLGDALQAMYETIVQEGVPDRFAKLLAQIDGNRDVMAGPEPTTKLDGSEEPRNKSPAPVATQQADRPLAKTDSLPKATHKGPS